MSRARDNADLGVQAGSGLDASDITSGALPVGVTGGSGLNALSASNLSAGIVPDLRMPNLTGAITTVEGYVATSITDDAITGGKLANDIAISTTGNIATTGSGTLAVAGTSTLTGNATASGNLTVSGDIVPSTPLSHRNMIINGAMNVAQRGTSSTSTQNQTVDRWKADFGGTGIPTVTQSQQDISSGNDAYNAGFRKSYRVALSGAGTTSSTSYCHINYPIEAQDLATSGWQYTSSSSYITLSFYVKVSTTQEFKCSLITQDGTAQVYTFAFTPTGTSWERIEHTIPGNSSITIDNNNGNGMTIYIFPFMPTNYTDASANNAWKAQGGGNYATDMPATWFEAGASTLDITGIQLELGSNATPFEHRSYGEELARCQRYYCAFPGDFANVGKLYSMVSLDMKLTVHIFYPVTMRVTPTISIGSSNLRYSDNSTWTANRNAQTISSHEYGYKRAGGGSSEHGMVIGNLTYTAEL